MKVLNYFVIRVIQVWYLQIKPVDIRPLAIEYIHQETFGFIHGGRENP